MAYVIKDSTGRIVQVFAHDPGPAAGAVVIDDGSPDLQTFQDNFAVFQQASDAYQASTDVVTRCITEGVAVPDAWRTYRAALMAILSGVSTGTTSATPTMPITTPAMPVGI
jgi:hypothetical protein